MKRTNLFVKTTIILILGGIITKILGFINRIIFTRIVGAEVMGLYSLVMPTYSLLITIATLALPTTISKLVAENKHNNLKIITTSTIFIMLINFIVVLFMIISAKFMALNLLHEERCYLLIIAMSLTFPIISISSIIKGYFYGKQNMLPNVISNIIEQIVRGILIYLIVPILIKKSIILASCSLFFFSFVEEFVSIIVNLAFIPKNIQIKRENLVFDKYTLKNILSISLPTVSSRIIGNIGYFFEPIILKNFLILNGYSNKYILVEYGAYNAYTIPILTVPSFFITAISAALIPEISKHFLTKNIKLLKKRLKESLFFALLIGLIYSGILTFGAKFILTTLYKTSLGLNYIKILIPIFPLFYLENVLMSFLQAINKAHITMKITIIGVIIKTLSLILFSYFHIGMYTLVISEIINIFLVVFLNIYYVHKFFKNYKYQSLSPSL